MRHSFADLSPHLSLPPSSLSTAFNAGVINGYESCVKAKRFKGNDDRSKPPHGTRPVLPDWLGNLAQSGNTGLDPAPYCSGADVRPLGPGGRSQRLEELVRAEAWGLGVCVNKGKRCGCVVV